MTRTDALLAAVKSQLEARRKAIDSATDLRSVTVDLKLSPDCLEPRDVIVRMEHGMRRRSEDR